ncbi:MAG: Uncharacterised protein [Prochlorococcus marinus str. MIT 9313]|nr:MAG: Uncharacterised protein [Prochlorococcus marinus str. MIT 9313]
MPVKRSPGKRPVLYPSLQEGRTSLYVGQNRVRRPHRLVDSEREHGLVS